MICKHRNLPAGATSSMLSRSAMLIVASSIMRSGREAHFLFMKGFRSERKPERDGGRPVWN
jgi:hypothetical protein